MQIKRKSHNLDARLLRRAQRTLGTATETETIHQALRAVLVLASADREVERIELAESQGTWLAPPTPAARRAMLAVAAALRAASGCVVVAL